MYSAAVRDELHYIQNGILYPTLDENYVDLPFTKVILLVGSNVHLFLIDVLVYH
jgi:hypothetical protein